MTDVFPLTPVPDDLAERNEYEGMILPLYALFRQGAAKGEHVIKGKTFTRCRIDGPSVLLALQGNVFERCYFGPDMGDIRNLILKPMGPERVTGAIPVADCRFIECNFFSMGFTGSDDFIAQFQAAAPAAVGEPQ